MSSLSVPDYISFVSASFKLDPHRAQCVKGFAVTLTTCPLVRALKNIESNLFFFISEDKFDHRSSNYRRPVFVDVIVKPLEVNA